MTFRQRNTYHKQDALSTEKKILIYLLAVLALCVPLTLVNAFLGFWVTTFSFTPICLYLLIYLQKERPLGNTVHPLLHKATILTSKTFLWIVVLFVPGMLVCIITPFGVFLPLIEALVIGYLFYKTKWTTPSTPYLEPYCEPDNGTYITPYDPSHCDSYGGQIIIINNNHNTIYPSPPYDSRLSGSPPQEQYDTPLRTPAETEDHKYGEFLILILLAIALCALLFCI